MAMACRQYHLLLGLGGQVVRTCRKLPFYPVSTEFRRVTSVKLAVSATAAGSLSSEESGPADKEASLFERIKNQQARWEELRTPVPEPPKYLLLATEESLEHFTQGRGGGRVHKYAKVDSSAIVEIGAVVHEHAQVGPHTRIGSGSILGPHVSIGAHSTVWYNVSLKNSYIGSHCVIHNGVCIGQDGFGFFVNDEGKMVKKPQMLQVKIGDNVELGANSCIDRGSWRDTVIGDNTKIDNQVQVGHNVIIGHSCMVCGQVGLGGSCSIGDYVVLGGKAGVADHVSVASKVRIAAKSGVTRNITKPGDYAGYPAVPAKEWRKSIVCLRMLGQPKSSPCGCRDERCSDESKL